MSVWRRVGVIIVLGWGLFAAPLQPVYAEEAATETRTEESPKANQGATSFEATDAVPTENVSGLSLMVMAYLVIWCLLLGYLFTIMRRQRRLRGELEALNARLEALDERVQGR